MGIEVVHDQYDLFSLGILYIHQIADDFREIQSSAPLGNVNFAPASQWLTDHENVGRALALIFVILACGLAGLRRKRVLNVRHQLLAGFIQTHLRPGRIVGALVNFQRILHRAHKIGIVLRRQDPLFFQPRLKFIFLSVLRTHSPVIDFTMLSSTSLSASNCNVQRTRPSGAALHATAIRRASCAPSNFR